MKLPFPGFLQEEDRWLEMQKQQFLSQQKQQSIFVVRGVRIAPHKQSSTKGFDKPEGVDQALFEKAMVHRTPFEERALKPSRREELHRIAFLCRLDGLTPHEEVTAPLTGLLLLQDLAWGVVLGHPPHQFWETFMCTCISINLCFALLENRDEGTIQAVQSYSTLFIIALSCVDVTLKSLAYGGRGYLSSLSDNCDFCVTLLMVSGQIWRDTDRNMAQDLASVLRVFGARLAFYRVPRLLRNWRFLRRTFLPFRGLVETVLQSLPPFLNTMALGMLFLYIFSILGCFWFQDLPPEKSSDPERHSLLSAAPGTVGIGNASSSSTELDYTSVSPSAYWASYERSPGISDRANFRTVPLSLSLLFRVQTGDQWVMVMRDCMHDVDGNVTAVNTVLSLIYFVTFIMVSFLWANLLIAVVLTQGFQAYFDAGLLVSSTQTHLLLKVKRRLMKPVYQLRQAKKLGGTVYTLVNDEKVMQAPDPPSPYYLAHHPMYLPYFWQLMQARMLEHLLSRLDEIYPEQLREPSEPPAAEHWLRRLPRTYNWLHSLPLCYYNQQQRPEDLDEKAASELLLVPYWQWRVSKALAPPGVTLTHTEVRNLFLCAIWEAALLAAVDDADVTANESSIKRRQKALARVHAMICYRNAFARSTVVSWILSGDSAFHAASFMGDSELVKLLMCHGASPRRPNSDGSLAFGREMAAWIKCICPWAEDKDAHVQSVNGEEATAIPQARTLLSHCLLDHT